MSKTFSEKTAYELEQEKHLYFNGNDDEIALNYMLTEEEYHSELWCKRQNTIGVYAVKSSYHKSIYLPFAITAYLKAERQYEVLTVEYRGMKSYKVIAPYAEKVIHELIDSEVIIYKGRFADMDKPVIRNLVKRYAKFSRRYK